MSYTKSYKSLYESNIFMDSEINKLLLELKQLKNSDQIYKPFNSDIIKGYNYYGHNNDIDDSDDIVYNIDFITVYENTNNIKIIIYDEDISFNMWFLFEHELFKINKFNIKIENKSGSLVDVSILFTDIPELMINIQNIINGLCGIQKVIYNINILEINEKDVY